MKQNKNQNYYPSQGSLYYIINFLRFTNKNFTTRFQCFSTNDELLIDTLDNILLWVYA